MRRPSHKPQVPTLPPIPKSKHFLPSTATMSHLVRRALFRAPRLLPTACRPLVLPQPRFISTTIRPRQAVDEEALDEPVAASLNDAPVLLDDETGGAPVDWSRSFHGLSTQPFSEEVSKILTAPLELEDVEIKPGTPPTLGAFVLTGGRWDNISSGNQVS